MDIEALIKKKIEENFSSTHIEVINESHLHEGHAGDDGSGQTHFKLIMVSSDFEGCSRIQRHRMVLDVVSDFFSQGMHAFSLNLFTLSEYKKK